MYTLAVGLIVASHFAFIGYVVAGGFLALRWRWTMWLHVPAVLWGAAIATNRTDCPLTWAERWARHHAGLPPLPPGGFIAHYVTGTLYPAGWLVGVQLAAFALVAVSWALYVRGR
ncbi:hypothetical protein BST11_10525 [Mycobacterium alsense]|uniref:DUF2784 domain-containing protein n=1 Tax=Mycobacterium alsense TaxID=324058 RepID=A0AA41XSA1_9MYCO|nr:DUF2784 domain-containing protein [Mycobacterium alsense]MCV7381211.1 DUF2784 domain-containing protein [Mycobacterium alsense]OQZ91037.1 hypothetical protein BST11_10525 [Mycobacterium alsense]